MIHRPPAALLVMLLLFLAFTLSACQEGATEDEPSMAELIAIVRGYDAATIRRTFPAYNTGLFARTYGTGPSIPLGGARQRAIFEEQLVRTPAGATIDVGHVIAGIEAGGPLPASALLVERLTGCQLRAAVTWSGDLGEAIAEYLVAGGAPDGSSAEMAVFFNRYASPEDLLGDLDGYILGAVLPDAPDIASLLTTAYLDGELEPVRFRRFVALFGDDLDALVSRETICFARALIQLGGASGPANAADVATAAPPFVERFLTFVRAGVAAERLVTP